MEQGSVCLSLLVMVWVVGGSIVGAPVSDCLCLQQILLRVVIREARNEDMLDMVCCTSRWRARRSTGCRRSSLRVSPLSLSFMTGVVIIVTVGGVGGVTCAG